MCRLLQQCKHLDNKVLTASLFETRSADRIHWLSLYVGMHWGPKCRNWMVHTKLFKACTNQSEIILYNKKNRAISFQDVTISTSVALIIQRKSEIYVRHCQWKCSSVLNVVDLQSSVHSGAETRLTNRVSCGFLSPLPHTRLLHRDGFKLVWYHRQWCFPRQCSQPDELPDTGMVLHLIVK